MDSFLFCFFPCLCFLPRPLRKELLRAALQQRRRLISCFPYFLSLLPPLTFFQTSASSSLRPSERLLDLDDCESRIVPKTPVREEITARTGRAFSAKRTYKMPLTGSSCKGRREDSIFIFLYDSHSCGRNHRDDASDNVWNRGNLRMHLSFFLF